MKARVTFAALVLGMSGLLVGGQAFSFEGEGTDYTLVVKKVDVKKTKADNSTWDIMDGAPDLFVRVSNNSEKGAKAFDTKVHDDKYTVVFDETTNVRFRSGQTISLEVIDKDVAANDDVGKINVEMTDKVIKMGKLRFENFGQVITLEIEVKKL